MNEFDRRQLYIMMQKINGFKSGYIYLSDLIYDLEALLNILEDTDQNWKDTFIGYWWDLEQVYAVAVDNEKTHLDFEEQNIINDAIKNLSNLIELKLHSNYKLQSD